MDDKYLYSSFDLDEEYTMIKSGHDRLIGAIGITKNNTVMLKINELQEKWDGVTPLNENSPIVKGKTVYIEFANRKGLEAIKSWLDGVSKTFDDIENNNIN